MISIGLAFRRLCLLLWKNLILRKRHYVITAFEIVLPTLFAVFMAYIRSVVELNSSNEIQPDENGDTGFPLYTEQDMVTSFLVGDPVFPRCTTTGTSYGNYCTIAYAPNSIEIRHVMDIFLDTVHASGFGVNYLLRGFATEDEIEAYQQELSLPVAQPEQLVGAVVFLADSLSSAGRITYKIRMPDSWSHMMTDSIFPNLQLPGPNFGNAKQYYEQGFSGFQILMDKSVISSLTSETLNISISSQAMPYPKYPALDFNQLYQLILPQLIVQGFIFTVPAVIRPVVSEKETGIKELMKMMGLPNWMYWFTWMMNSFITQLLSVTVMVVLYFVEFNSKSGAVLIYSDPTIWWFVLMMFTLSATCFCFFVSAFFNQATLATTVGIVAWIALYQPLTFVIDYNKISLAEKMLTCLLPNMAIHYAVTVMCAFEAKGEGAKWTNIGTPLSSNDSFTLAHALGMFLINSFLYVVLAMYVEKIMPTKYGVRKPWYYIFQISSWCSKKSSPEDEIGSAESVRYRQREETGFEKEPTDIPVGVDIRGLRKVFGKAKIAVDNVTCRMYQGQITALLGHNGAGKSTTMSMITGLYSPTKGTAFVNGYDIAKHIDKVRENLGLCPQHNMLFNSLTVSEHLRFFGMLKGASSSATKAEMTTLLSQMDLEEKKNTLAMSLSGGQKRKLSLGCALIGGSEIVILDEPTSGMDPEARRKIWDLLLQMRGQRTIILSTHFMEEADVLGDRIAIMAEGKLQCCGTPMFLKQFYGAGYTLKITTDEIADSDFSGKILAIVQRSIPEAYSKSQNQANLKELSIVLPMNNARTSVFVQLFQDLSQGAIKKHVETLGLSLTTMDEVFVKVGELSNVALLDQQLGDPSQGNSVHSSTSRLDINLGEIGSSRTELHSRKITGLNLTFQQFSALIMKRILFTSRKWRYFISQFLFPVGLLILAIVVSNQGFTTPQKSPPLQMSFNSYKRPMTMYFSPNDSESNLVDAFRNTASRSGSTPIQANPSTRNLTKSLLQVGYDDLGAYRESYVAAAEITSSNVNAMFSTIPYHAAPLAINLASNTLLNVLLGDQMEIQVINHPLENRLYDLISPLFSNPAFANNVARLFSVFLPLGLALLAATYCMFPIDEKSCKSKQLQLMTGVSPISYWSSSFLWDYFMLCIVICVMCSCFPIFETGTVYTSNNGIGVVFLFLAVFGFAAISFSYLLSLWAKSVAGGFVLVTIIHVITSFLTFIVDALASYEPADTIRELIRWAGRLFPAYGASVCSYQYSLISAQNNVCERVSDELKSIICVPDFPYGQVVQRCCDNCKELGAQCFEPSPFLVWKDPSGEPGMGQELLYMTIMAFVYQLLLIVIELGLFVKVKSLLFKASRFTFRRKSDDEDVTRESDRVQSFVNDYSHRNTASTMRENDALLVSNLCKSYGSFAAVSNLSFGVRNGECFGLLGVNGAGKTTSFRMLTGDEVRSDGNAYAIGSYSSSTNNSQTPYFYFTLENDRKWFLSNIGYCPQFDGLISVLTGREMLQLYARLRGVPATKVNEQANKWLEKLGLADAATVQSQNYSGGMKRRLSAAMAMVGEPPILFLDEPTSGVDPVARRQFWKVIESIRNAGQAVVLTSHSMEECEALCNRLGIMVNGELQCLGGVQHLKNKFAQGYSLTIKLKSAEVRAVQEAQNSFGHVEIGGILPSRVHELIGEVQQGLQPCELKDQHQNILQFQVYNTALPWDILFKTLESIKSKYESILEDYSVNGTTLEEVFLSFARKQYAGRQVAVPLWKKVTTCQCFSS